MKKTTLLSVFVLGSVVAYAQNIAINTSGAAAANCAILDVNTSAGNLGMLIPRMALTDVTVYAPLTGAAVDGVIIYNTAAAPIGGNGTGYYFWSTAAARWVNLIDNLPPSGAWLTTGNTNLNAATNYIGTTDAVDLVVRTTAVERMRILTTGQVGIGTSAPAANTFLEVSSGATSDAIYGHSNQVGGVLGKEVNISFGTPVQSLLGAGVYASNPSANYTSTFAQSTGAANVAAAIAFSSVWIASYNYVENASAAFNPTVVYGQLNVSNGGLVGGVFKAALYGYSNYTGAGDPASWTNGGLFVANGVTNRGIGIRADAYGSATSAEYGSYVYAAGFGSNYLYSADNWNNRKATGTGGAVSEVIPTTKHGRVMLTTPESPEYWYQDYGSVQLVNGKAHVDLDPILIDICVIDAQNPIKVFTTINDPNCKGVAVVKSTTGFDIVELNNGTSNSNIDYQIILRPKTNYGEGRFPQGPGPVGAPEDIPLAKTKNQHDRAKTFRWPSDDIVYGYKLEKMKPQENKKPSDR